MHKQDQSVKEICKYEIWMNISPIELVGEMRCVMLILKSAAGYR